MLGLEVGLGWGKLRVKARFRARVRFRVMVKLG